MALRRIFESVARRTSLRTLFGTRPMRHRRPMHRPRRRCRGLDNSSQPSRISVPLLSRHQPQRTNRERGGAHRIASRLLASHEHRTSAIIGRNCSSRSFIIGRSWPPPTVAPIGERRTPSPIRTDSRASPVSSETTHTTCPWMECYVRSIASLSIDASQIGRAALRLQIFRSPATDLTGKRAPRRSAH